MDANRILYGWAVNALGIFIAAMLNLVSYHDKFFTLLLAALVLGIINVLIRPVITILSIPAIVMTLGLFVFVVNALMLWLTSLIVGQFDVLGFWHTVGAAIVIGVVNLLLHAFLRDVTKEQIKHGTRSAR